jgi:hypothetical protein
MKTFSTLLFVLACSGLAFCQEENSDYYRPVFPSPVGSKKYTVESLLKKFGDVRIHNRWYSGINGFVRTDKNKITNNFDGLIGTSSPASYGWSAVVGWVKDENWGVEAEYARSPIHNNLVINGDNPLNYKLTNEKNSLIFRGKRRIMFGKTAIRRSAFWLSAGAGLIPNTGKQTNYMEFNGYMVRGRRQGIDTLFMSSDTRTNKHITALAEASAEYVVKVAKSVDLAFFVRKQWGFGNSVTTNLEYSVNQVKTATASITGDGSGWNFGMSLRYVFHIGYDYENLNRKDSQ